MRTHRLQWQSVVARAGLGIGGRCDRGWEGGERGVGGAGEGERAVRLEGSGWGKVGGFVRAYVKSMRLYYSFITGIAGWLGVAYYEHLAGNPVLNSGESPISPGRKLTILVIFFLSWGVNQIINDYLGLAEDRVNAPERPMVTGELNPTWAVGVSFFLMIGAGVVTWVFLEPIAVIFLGAGVVLNVVYEKAKGHGWLGNLVFGLMIVMAPLYGGYASGPTQGSIFYGNRISVLLMVVVMNAVMTFYTYFKDFRGDLLAGKRTLVVLLGVDRARWLGLAMAWLPTLVFLVLHGTGLHTTPLNSTFFILGGLTVLMQVWTGCLYWRCPSGAQAYRSLAMNFRACVCGQATLIAIFNPEIATWLFLFAYILVGLLFELHENHRQ